MAPGGEAGRFVNDLRTEVAAIDDFPAASDPPVVRQLHRTDMVATVAIAGDLPDVQLDRYAAGLQDRLAALPDVADVKMTGIGERRFRITVSRAVLVQHGLTASGLAARIAAQSIDRPLGLLETKDREVTLRFTDERRTAAALSDLVVLSKPNGAELTLGQIARIEETYNPAEARALLDGQRAVFLQVDKALGADALRVFDRVTELVAAERAALPGSLRLEVVQDMTTIVRDRLAMLVKNGIIGLVLVVAVMSLFFRPGYAIWAAMGLPVAFLGAFVVMAVTGLSLNMITLVALLMAIGIVMDDAVVIVDNIAVHAAEQPSALAAVAEGTRQVLPGVLSSFLTTVAVFAPLSFLAGELGAVLEVLPVVLLAALAASLIEAFWILPHHLKGSIPRLRAGGAGGFRGTFDRGFGAFRERVVGRLVDGAIRWRYGVLGLAALVLFGSAGFLAGGHIGSEAMPDIDGDVLEARILMPQGTPLARTEAVAGRLEEAIRRIDERLTPEQPGQAPLVEAIQTRFNYNPSAGEAGTHVATVMLDLLTAERRTLTLDELTAAWRAQIGTIPGIHSLIIQEPGFGPAGVPIEMRLQGEDLGALKAAAVDAADHLTGYAATYNVMDDLRPGRPQRSLSLAAGAHSLGLSAEDVAGQLRAAWLGQIADTQRVGQRDVEILVSQPESDRASLDDLVDQTITLPSGEQVPLGEVAEIREERGWAQIARIDGRRTVTVEANVDARRSSGQDIVADLCSSGWLADFRDRHPGVGVVFEGQTSRSAETGASIGRGLLIGLVGIFVILSFQFRSYVEPLIVMLSIPLAFIGAIWGHVLTGYYLSMPSLVGAAGLAGIAVNNAILLIHFIKMHRERGLAAVQAAAQASRDRLRAILITSSTTIAGLLPLLLETSTQADAIKPLVVSVVFGLVSITVLALVVIPALYVLFDDWGWARSPAEEGGGGQ